MGVGPTVLVLRQATGWTFGFLVNKIWSFASDENRTDVDQMFSQPFFCKELKKGDEVSPFHYPCPSQRHKWVDDDEPCERKGEGGKERKS